MSHVSEVFSSMVFDDATMEARLPKETYRALKNRSVKVRRSTVPSRQSSQTP